MLRFDIGPGGGGGGGSAGYSLQFAMRVFPHEPVPDKQR